MAPGWGRISLIVAVLLVEQIRCLPRPEADSFQDDEDMGASGDGSGREPPAETGRVPIPDTSTNLIGATMDNEQRQGKVFYRIQLQLTGAKYTLSLDDRSSQAFKDLTDDLQQSVAAVYLKLPGKQIPSVVQYSPGPTNNLYVTLEMSSEEFYDEKLLREALQNVVRTGMLGAQAVTSDKFDFLPIGNAGSCPYQIGPEPTNYPQLGSNNARLILNQIFPCSGHVTAFEYHRGSQNGGVYITIWRLVGVNQYKLLKKVYAPPATIGVHRVTLDRPVYVRDGDFVGFHYDENAEENVINFTSQEDQDLTENELYRVYNVMAFDNVMVEGNVVDLAPYTGSEKLETYALRSILDYGLAPPKTGCNEDQYQCFDDTCVPLAARCNGRPECLDGSDEFECPTSQCTFKQFMCGDLSCVEGNQRCDGVTDCPDGTDERGCIPVACKPDQFLCRSGPCIPIELRCDGEVQCPDATDEVACVQECTEQEFTCPGTKRCVELRRKCDGVNDCTDGADEAGCREPCTNEEFTCEIDKKCVSESNICDGRPNCVDASDEKGCGPCASDLYTCPNDGFCLLQSKLCDGTKDCLGGDDEANCGCRTDQFTCPDDGYCLDKAQLCDGENDCRNGADEQKCGCLDEELECPNSTPQNRVCVAKERICDGVSDCLGDEDEVNCPCRADQFTCPDDGSDDVYCLDKTQLCDGKNDCRNGADEQDCGCTADQFTCPDDGYCLDKAQLCDGENDCRNGADEKNCGCRTDQFTCPDDGYCLEKARLCDGENDCRNGADEKNCGCRTDQFTCPDDGYCLDKAQLCDGENDCRNGADEQNCKPVCRSDQFQCPDTGLCLEQTQKCDGRRDCESAADEAACVPIMVMINPTIQTVYLGDVVRFQCASTGSPPPEVKWSKAGGSLPSSAAIKGGLLTIPRAEAYHAGDYVCTLVGPPDVYQETAMLVVQPFGPPTTPGPPRGDCDVGQTECANRQCIGRSYLCDGENDCADGSDERNCRDEFGCEPNEMRCRNERCISRIWKCDGDNDCNDNTDEENCPVAAARSACRTDEWQCQSRDQCVPKSYQCDGEIDCQDRSDEMGCRPPFVITPPPAMEMVEYGGTVSITCKAGGTPSPLIVWRLNWGHVAKPPRVTQTSEDGYGVLTIRNAQKEDQGAYTCEALNSKGAIFAEPDTVLKVKPPVGLCRAPLFNAEANDESECLRCFCYGHTSQCTSSSLYRAQISISNKPSLVTVKDPTPFDERLIAFNAGNREFSIRDVLDLVPNRDYYWQLPDEFTGDQVKSYGGSLSFRLFYQVSGRVNPYNKADVIIEGNDITLYHKYDTLPVANKDQEISIPFREGAWRRSEFKSAVNVDAVSREDLMMVLAKVKRILLKLRFDNNANEIRLSNLVMDTAVQEETGQARAAQVEGCSCPEGYTGTSCEVCATGYHRSVNGRNGECVPCNCHSHSDECDMETGVCKDCRHNTEGVHCEFCQTGYYGDARVGTSRDCTACPCPLTVKSNQFTHECFQDASNNNRITCTNCPEAYEGLLCERCKPGYIGNPMVVGDYCRAAEQRCNPHGSLSNVPLANGQCSCKPNTEGKACDRCRSETFGLSRDFETGCLACLCMGVATACSEGALYRAQVKSNFRSGNDDFTLTNLDKTVLTQKGFDVQTVNNKLSFEGFDNLGAYTFYWNLPKKFLGNQIHSYGGMFSSVVTFIPGANANRNSDPDVIIRGAGLVLTYSPRSPRLERVPQAMTIPLIEDAWRKEDGSGVRRGDLMMVLAQLESFMVKATYTLTTREASIQSVSLDSASRQNGGNSVRVTSVEVCYCPPGYQGNSCEECSSGYRRVEGGNYLGQCVRCQCNGRSDTCDPETGECLNCRDNTAGASCDQCAAGYYGDASRGSSNDCQPETRDCNCDVRGTIQGRVCDSVTKQCPCKDHVTGLRCNSCKAGYFGLSQDLPTGCSQCWCSGLSSQCESAGYYSEQIGFTLDGSGRTELALVTQRDYSDPVIFNGYAYDRSINGVRFNNFDAINTRDPLYWTLPNTFLENKMTSYGGFLRYTADYQADSGARPVNEADVELVADRGVTRLYYKYSPALENKLPNNRVTVSLRLVESSFRDSRGRIVDRATLMRVLSDLDAILIRASIATKMSYITLGEVTMDTAVARDNGRAIVSTIERCQCPTGYTGHSCRICAPGYQRDAFQRCLRSAITRCECNGHSQTCDETGRCLSCIHNTYGDRCDQCANGYYGDARRGTVQDCKECPCPLTIASNKFSATCVLDTDSLPTCTSCARGYTGRNCETCTAGYYGNPLEPGDTCRFGVAPQLPLVTVRPDDVTSDVGDVVRFTCNVIGSEPLQLRWLRADGRALSSSAVTGADRSLTIDRIRSEDQGEYICLATNSVGQGRDSGNLRVTVDRDIDVYIEEPRYLNINEGRTARFVCKARSQGSSTLVWSRRDGAAMSRNAFQRDGLLTIPVTTLQSRGIYICSGRNSFGQTDTAEAELNVGALVEPPDVKITPRYQTVNVGERVEIRCTATGRPEPTLEFVRVKGLLNPDATFRSGVFVIPVAKKSDEAEYACKARNAGGDASMLSVLYVRGGGAPPIVRIDPTSSQTVSVGSSAVVECRVTSGTEPVTITWARADGRGLPSGVFPQSNGILRLTRVTNQEAGDYVCTGTNQYGTSTATASVNLQSIGLPPVIRVKPTSPIRVLEGSEVRMECTANGLPDPTVYWQKLADRTGLDAPAGRREASRQSATLLINRASLTDSGTYVCTATNAAGTAEERVVLEVIRDTSIAEFGSIEIEGAEEQRVREGTNVELVCRASGVEGGFDITWRRADGRALPSNAYSDDYTLYIDNIRLTDAGEYYCVAKARRSAQELQRPVTVIVITTARPPTLTVDPPNSPLVVQEGTDVVITCRSGSDPVPEITWQKQGDTRRIGPYRGQAEQRIERARIEDAGTYVCVGRNAGGSAEVRVEVRVEARRRDLIIEGPANGQVLLSSDTVLMCKVRADIGGRWYYTWTLDGAEFRDNAYSDGASMYVDGVSAANAGNYRCTARSSDGDSRVLEEVYPLRVVAEASMPDSLPMIALVPERAERVVVGRSVQIKCQVVSGYPKPQVTWSRASGRPLGTQTFAVADGELRITSYKQEDQDQYVCTARNRAGHVSKTIRITAVGGSGTTDGTTGGTTTGGGSAAEQLTIIGPSNGRVAEGSNCVLICALPDQATGEYRINWDREGSTLPTNSRQEEAVLYIDRAGRADGGRYVCRAQSSSDSRQLLARYDVQVLQPSQFRDASPQIEIFPRTLRGVALGSSLTLHCVAVAGYPYPQIGWTRKSGRPLSATTRAVGGRLVFQRLSRDDEDTYTCTATNRVARHSGDATVTLSGGPSSVPGAPRITVDPRGPLRLDQGRPLRITCRATGAETPDVYWLKTGSNQRLAAGRGQAELVFNQFTSANSGIYTCHATNAYGASRESIRLDVVSTGVVRQQEIYIEGPRDGIVEIGSDVMLKCRVRDTTGRYYYDWRMDTDGDSFGGNVRYDDATLYIDRVTATDAGRYRCVAQSASDGRRLETVIDIKPTDRRNMRESPPVLVITPDTLTNIAVGSNFVLQCRAISGFPKPDVTWKRSSGRAFTGTTRLYPDGRLEFTRLSAADEDQYVCTAQNRFGTVNGTVNLRLNKASEGVPELRISPEATLTVERGATASFICEVIGGGQPVTLRWIKEDGVMSASARLSENGELRLSDVTDRDAGFYVCQASNSYGNVTRPALLRLVDTGEEARGLNISPYPGTLVKAGRGTSVTLRCHVPGQALLQVTWSRQGQALPASSSQNTSAGELVISDVTPDDQGVYFCHVTTDAGQAREQINLRVGNQTSEGIAGATPPRVSIPQGGVFSQKIGDSAKLECHVTGANPPATIVWKRTSGKPLPQTALLNLFGTLQLTDLQTEDEDQYICTAVNSAGSASAHVKLNVRHNAVPISAGAPRILLSQGERMSVAVGASLSFDCRAEGDPTPRVYWSRGTPVAMERGEVGLATYVITKATMEDAGWYQCTAHSEHGKAYKRVELRVTSGGDQGSEDSLVIEGAGIRKVNVGETLQLVCRSTDVDLDLHWSKKRGILPVNHRVSEGVLYLYQLRAEDSGEYVCSASIEHDGVETEYHKHVEVVVLGPPSVRISPPVVEAGLGEAATLICDAEGFGDITVKWLKEGGLTENARDDGFGYLEFDSVTAADAGRYKCEAVNDAGSSEAFADLIVVGLPSASFASGLSRVTVGDKARLECLVSGSPTPQIRWEKDNGPLPAEAQTLGATLSIPSVELSHTGVYSCTAANPSGTARAFIQLLVSEAETGAGGVDLTGVREISSKTRTVNTGDRVELGCEVKGSPPPTTRWVRDNGPLPSEAVIVGNTLTLPKVATMDGGTYRCIATNQAGSVQAKVTLIITDGSPGRNSGTASLNRKAASVGSDVTLTCHTPRGTTPTWKKLNGTLPSGYVMSGRELRLENVEYDASGQYTCEVNGLLLSGEREVIELIIGDLIPYFLQEELSYMTFPPMPNTELDFDIEISFKPDDKDGLLLYQGSHIPGEGEFMAFGLNDGHVEFKYDSGSGQAMIVSDVALRTGEWCHAHLKRHGKHGVLNVNGREYEGQSPGNDQRLQLESDLYVGGVPNYDNIPRSVGFQSGFKGTISHIGMGGVSVNLGVAPTSVVGVTEYDACSDKPCQNKAWCVTANRGEGYKCQCQDGFTGYKCERRGQGCFPGACGKFGHCQSTGDQTGFMCTCPVGRSGYMCQSQITINTPSFNKSSYISYRPLGEWVDIAMQLKSDTLEDSLVFYNGERRDGSGQFLALLLERQKLTLLFDLGTGSRVMKQIELFQANRWTDVRIEMSETEMAMEAGGERVTTRLVGRGDSEIVAASLRRNLYFGGLPETEMVNFAVDTRRGFQGCISKVLIDSEEVSLVADAQTSAGISECASTLSCRTRGCSNDALCKRDAELGLYCDCGKEYNGLYCQTKVDVCQRLNNCLNEAVCYSNDSQPRCACPIGYSGQYCETRVILGEAAAFSGKSYLELPANLMPQRSSRHVKETIRFTFRTSDENGSMYWFGQDARISGHGEDFVSIGMKDGRVEFNYELGSGVASIVSRGRYNDGYTHSLLAVRSGTLGTLVLDGDETVNGASDGILKMLNTNGNIYIGGVPDYQLMTSSRYTTGFNGCIRDINLMDSGVIADIQSKAVSARDVTDCGRTQLLRSGRGLRERLHGWWWNR